MAVHVAVAVIINKNDQVLITKRSADQHQGNKWEFPGGKVEESETSQEALYREMKEELGINIQSPRHMMDIMHQYNDKKVFLDVYEVKKWQGEPQGLENQPLCWVNKAQLSQYEFPDANTKIIRVLNKLD